VLLLPFFHTVVNKYFYYARLQDGQTDARQFWCRQVVSSLVSLLSLWLSWSSGAFRSLRHTWPQHSLRRCHSTLCRPFQLQRACLLFGLGYATCLRQMPQQGNLSFSRAICGSHVFLGVQNFEFSLCRSRNVVKLVGHKCRKSRSRILLVTCWKFSLSSGIGNYFQSCFPPFALELMIQFSTKSECTVYCVFSY